MTSNSSSLPIFVNGSAVGGLAVGGLSCHFLTRVISWASVCITPPFVTSMRCSPCGVEREIASMPTSLSRVPFVKRLPPLRAVWSIRFCQLPIMESFIGSASPNSLCSQDEWRWMSWFESPDRCALTTLPGESSDDAGDAALRLGICRSCTTDEGPSALAAGPGPATRIRGSGSDDRANMRPTARLPMVDCRPARLAGVPDRVHPLSKACGTLSPDTWPGATTRLIQRLGRGGRRVVLRQLAPPVPALDISVRILHAWLGDQIASESTWTPAESAHGRHESSSKSTRDCRRCAVAILRNLHVPHPGLQRIGPGKRQ